jgi:putative ABC transport system permease protein
MMFFHRIPLAWRNLLHDKRRFLVSLTGIAFAVVLMFVELGFWNALLDAAVELVRRFNCQLVIVNKARYALAIREPFTTRRLGQARAVPGVKEVVPIYLEYRTSLWKDTENARPGEPSSRPIRVVAFDPGHAALRIPEVTAQLDKLQLPDTVLMDRRSKPDYGKRVAGIERELARRSVRVVGTFELGTDFTTDGNLIMSDLTYAQLFRGRASGGASLGLADVGLVQVDESADVAGVRKALQSVLPDDVCVYTLGEFAAKERVFWQYATPVGFIFTFGLVMGVIVGMVICSQILSADVADHLKEYATLKAIGYPDRYLTWVVLQEALWLSLLGFVPALLLSLLLYDRLGEVTGLPLFLTPGRIGLILFMTVFMCIVAGVLALRKVRKADPAEVFG